jgi:putative NADH-flavin reductase
MHITVFGATGGTGTSLVRQALAAGHQVTAVVRDPARLAVTSDLGSVPVTGAPVGPLVTRPITEHHTGGAAAPPRLAVVTADVLDPAAIAPPVAGADAVISAIGPRGGGPTTVSHDSATAIIAAMHATGARRLVTISGSIVTDDGDDLLLRLVKPLVRRTQLRHVCADMRRAEEEVRHSGLEWTIMRPPRLTGKPAAGHYRTAIDRNLPRDYTISREDLAACILGLIADPEAVRKHVAVAN